MDLLDRMLGHDRWATAHLLELSRDLDDDRLDRPFDIGHETLRATFDHMIFNVAAWTALMAGESMDGARGGHSLPDLIDRHERSYTDFAALARRVRDDVRLDETYVDNYGYPQSFGGTIVHVVRHNAQHRAEARHILERLNVPDLPEGDPQGWEHATGLVKSA